MFFTTACPVLQIGRETENMENMEFFDEYDLVFIL